MKGYKHYRKTKDHEDADVVIGLEDLDVAFSKLLRCGYSETECDLIALIDWRIKEYFRRCLRNSKKKRGKGDCDCQIDTTYGEGNNYYIDDGDDDYDNGEDSGDDDDDDFDGEDAQ